MLPNRTLTGEKARLTILKGVNSIYEPVSKTFGPAGKNALLYGTFGREPRFTTDGYTVGDCIVPEDIFIRIVARAFQETCRKTNEKVGDGTTLTTLLAARLVNDVFRMLSNSSGSKIGGNSINVMQLKDDIFKSAELVKEEIKKATKKIKNLAELEKIVSVSIKDKKLGKLIAQIVWDVGIDGYIDVIEGYQGKIETEIIKGARFAAKVPDKIFINHKDKYEMVCEDTAILITNYSLKSDKQLDEILNPLVKEGNKKIAIFAPEFSNKTIGMLFNVSYPLTRQGDGTVIRTKGSVDLFPVLIPSLKTEELEDLGVVCQANVIDKNKGMQLSAITSQDLGFAEKIIVKDVEVREDAQIIGGAGTKTDFVKNKEKKIGFDNKEEEEKTEIKKTPVQERLEILKEQLELTRKPMFKEMMKRRIANISSSIGIIKVDAATRAEAYYLKKKIEDGKCAGQSALRSGYVRGGGLCLKEIADKLPANDILKGVLKEPYDRIQNSMGGDFEIEPDIFDPMESIYYGVEYGISVAANLITVDAIITETEEQNMEKGLNSISNAILEGVIADKLHKGQIKVNEEETYKDALNGLSEEQYIKEQEYE